MDETQEPAPTSEPEETPRPVSFSVAAGLVGIEALALVALAVVGLFSLSDGKLALGLTNSIFFLLYAVGLALCARALLRESSWARSPIVMTQIIQLGVAWSFYGNNTAWLAVILAVVAVAVIGIMFAPSTTQRLFGNRIWSEPER